MAEVNGVNQPLIAIEDNLSPYQRVLEQAGFQVTALDDHTVGIAQAIVVQGTDNNFLGIDDPKTLAPVINADGMTPHQVLQAVQERALKRT